MHFKDGNRFVSRRSDVKNRITNIDIITLPTIRFVVSALEVSRLCAV